MVSGFKRIIFIWATLAALILICLVFSATLSDEDKGILHVEPGNSSLYISSCHLTIPGQDKDGVTYFFIPSYAGLDVIEQDESNAHMYLKDGSLLTSPCLGTIQEILVDTGDGSLVPWQTAFFQSEGLYTAYVDLMGRDVYDIDHDSYMPSSISLYTPYGKLEYTDQDAMIKGRGNTTWDAVKQPYEIKLSSDYPLCGMESGSKWALLANFYDDTKILNKMIMDLSCKLGMEYAIESDWVDLYVNGEYRGNYLLCKDPGIGKGRLNLSDGYFIEKDNRTGPNSPRPHFNIGDDYFKIKDPLPVDEENINELQGFISRVDEDIREATGKDKTSHIDIPSFAMRFMTDEFCFRSASMQTNCYFYNRGDTLYAGPCWDYDLVCGKPLSGSYYLDYTKSLLDHIPEDALLWDVILMQDPLYRDYYDRLFDSSAALFFDLIQNDIDAYAERIAPSLKMDTALWHNDENPVRFYEEPENKYRYVRFFLYQRLCLLWKECHMDQPLPDFDINTSDTHVLTFIKEDGTKIKWNVRDGELLSADSLPEYDDDLYEGWVYVREQVPFSPYIPLYEDMTLELRPKD